MKKGLWILFVVLAIIIGLYPSIYFFKGRNFGLISSKEPELLQSVLWNIAFYTHIILGGIALLIGWPQFSSKFRSSYLGLHRKIGKVYVFSVLLSALAGIYIGFFATGGIISELGFITLGFFWFCTTLSAYLYVRKKQINQHQIMMIYSYALCFAAVMLRLWLPILASIFGDFIKAYVIVAWLCWVPNIFVAYFITKKLKKIEV